MNKQVLLFPILLLLDIGTKAWAFVDLPPLHWSGYPFGGVPLFENVMGISCSLNLVFNTGAAWGFFQGYPGLLFVLRVAIIALCGSYLFFFRKGTLQTIPFLLIGAGAIGNSIDYLVYGHVIDFFHFVFWESSFPVFNIADACITLGAIGLILQGRYDVKRLSNTK